MGERGEYYALLLLSVAGMTLMAHAWDLIMVFLAMILVYNFSGLVEWLPGYLYSS